MKFLIPCFFILFLSSCVLDRQSGSGPVNYDVRNERLPETPPGMVLIENATTISPFEGGLAPGRQKGNLYVSIYEETNSQYCAYLNFLRKHLEFKKYIKALPDTNVWMKEKLSDDEKNYLIKNYLRNPEFSDYPVVGINTQQAQDYCYWKTDRINEMLLVRENILNYENVNYDDDSDYFKTDVYLSGTYVNNAFWHLPRKQRKQVHYGERDIRIEDGILIPRLNLPTKYEWQQTALYRGNHENKYIVTPKPVKDKDSKKKYPYLFNTKKKLKLTPLQEKLKLCGLVAVYEGTKNKYGIFNLGDNVSELILADSLSPPFIGDCWKNSETYFRTYEMITVNDSIQYLQEIEKKIVPSAAIGFRTVTPCIWDGDNKDLKRTKRK